MVSEDDEPPLKKPRIEGKERTYDTVEVSVDFNAISNNGEVSDPVGDGCASIQKPVNEEVCFGMIAIDSFKPAKDSPHPSLYRSNIDSNALRIRQDGVVYFQKTSSSTEVAIGTIDQRMGQILYKLDQNQGMSIQLRCILKYIYGSQNNRKEHRPSMKPSWSFYAIVYGWSCASRSVGDFLEACDIFLQDPRGCDRNVPYRNPHMLRGFDEDVPMTGDEQFGSGKNKQSLSKHTGYLDGFATHSDLPMAKDPVALQTKLHPYQKQALYFFKRRELGWGIDGHFQDLWTKAVVQGMSMYVNTITDDACLEAPPEFKGGLLADHMGLGKTLSMISLIASDLELSQTDVNQQVFRSHHTTCTLVIVPPNLLGTWEFQLQKHCKPGTLRWSRHHDQIRFTSVSQTISYNVILTTYNTVTTEWRNYKDSSVLYAINWHRIILDEAHCIRDERGQFSKAICDLKASRRWAVTGTPIQNHFTDLTTLLKFLQVYPYNKRSNFERDIISLWKIDPEAAVSRLKKLISSITIRRTGEAINLPLKTEVLYTLPFNRQEQELYYPAEYKVMSMFNDLSSDRSDQSTGRRNALKGLLLLRSICNYGVLTDLRKFEKRDTSSTAWTESDAQFVLEAMIASNTALCAKCSNDISSANNTSSDLGEDIPDDLTTNPTISQCEQILCGPCASQSPQNKPEPNWCGHSPSCPTTKVSTSNTSSVVSLASLGPRLLNPTNLPTKIKAITDDITLHPTSKCVIFSTWRTTLDLLSFALTTKNIQSTRYDGHVKPTDRASALARFRTDPATQVLLITMSCGAVGLDLTVAERAYITEPQWNPTVEDHALARIYRMGQTRPVTIVRTVMADSVELRVVEVQGFKRGFADLLLASTTTTGSRRGGGGSGGGFEVWRRLLT